MTYEFTPEQDVRLRRTARLVRAWGWVSLVVGLSGLTVVLYRLTGSALPLPAPSLLPVAPLLLVRAAVAGLYLTAGRELEAIADTAGQDIPHALAALDGLGRAFRIEAIATVLALVAGVGTTLLVVFEIPP